MLHNFEREGSFCPLFFTSISHFKLSVHIPTCAFPLSGKKSGSYIFHFYIPAPSPPHRSLLSQGSRLRRGRAGRAIPSRRPISLRPALPAHLAAPVPAKNPCFLPHRGPSEPSWPYLSLCSILSCPGHKKTGPGNPPQARYPVPLDRALRVLSPPVPLTEHGGAADLPRGLSAPGPPSSYIYKKFFPGFFSKPVLVWAEVPGRFAAASISFLPDLLFISSFVLFCLLLCAGEGRFT